MKTEIKVGDIVKFPNSNNVFEIPTGTIVEHWEGVNIFIVDVELRLRDSKNTTIKYRTFAQESDMELINSPENLTDHERVVQKLREEIKILTEAATDPMPGFREGEREELWEEIKRLKEELKTLTGE